MGVAEVAVAPHRCAARLPVPLQRPASPWPGRVRPRAPLRLGKLDCSWRWLSHPGPSLLDRSDGLVEPSRSRFSRNLRLSSLGTPCRTPGWVYSVTTHRGRPPSSGNGDSSGIGSSPGVLTLRPVSRLVGRTERDRENGRGAILHGRTRPSRCESQGHEAQRREESTPLPHEGASGSSRVTALLRCHPQPRASRLRPGRPREGHSSDVPAREETRPEANRSTPR